METAPLKSFATWARRELITQVSARLTAVLAPSSPERVENQRAVATLERDIEGGVEVLEVDLPFVVSAAKGMAEQRIPNMKGIMGARTKPLKVVEPVAADQYTSIVSFELPAAKQGVKLVSPDSPEELVRLLHEEARVI